MPPNLVLIIGVALIPVSMIADDGLLFLIAFVLSCLGYWIHLHE